MNTETRSPRPASKAIKKFRCVSLVNSLAKNWQKWANEHSLRQKSEPQGWLPEGFKDDDPVKENRSWITKQERLAKVLQIKPESTRPGRNVNSSKELSGSQGTELSIRTIPVTKTVNNRSKSGSNELVSFMTDRFNQPEPDVAPKPFLANRSPTRRRLCHKKASEISQTWEKWEKEEKGSVTGEDRISGGEKRKEKEPKKKDDAADRGKRKRSVPNAQVRTMEDLKKAWLRWAEDHIERQKTNPFSDEFDYDYAKSLRLKKGDQGYGQPKEGSKTAERGQRAQEHVYKEMQEMCFIIRTMGILGVDGKTRVTFANLFDRYVTVSDKVVGILMRARKHGLLDFQGEMLWKGEHDDVVITLNE
ncbi:actin-binding Rho-activating protein [Hemiscyllium ocellatum]|uniref:actin-binding Rho-activating protein n=1 Tax=Hemiscyllium ocellatum TaxID=170820 RepID=UPI0029661774|nr:actin-binding Rho-activating protein [Hemiscyllium ocellatum]